MGIGRDVYQTLMMVHPSKFNELVKTKEGLERRHQCEKILMLKLFLYGSIFWVASEFAYVAFDVPSRRLCNISWFCFEVWIMVFCFFLIYSYDRFAVDRSTPNTIIDAFGLNQLWIFGMSNLLCGLINITIKTLYLTYY